MFHLSSGCSESCVQILYLPVDVGHIFSFQYVHNLNSINKKTVLFLELLNGIYLKLHVIYIMILSLKLRPSEIFKIRQSWYLENSIRKIWYLPPLMIFALVSLRLRDLFFRILLNTPHPCRLKHKQTVCAHIRYMYYSILHIYPGVTDKQILNFTFFVSTFKHIKSNVIQKLFFQYWFYSVKNIMNNFSRVLNTLLDVNRIYF